MIRRGLELLLYAASPLALLITSPILAQGLGPEDRGVLGTTQAAVTLAVAVGSLGQAELLLSKTRGIPSHYRSHAAVALGGGTIAATCVSAYVLLSGSSISLAVLVLVLAIPHSQMTLWRAVVVRNMRTIRPALANAVAALVRIVGLVALALVGLVTLPSAFGMIEAGIVLGGVGLLWSFVWRSRSGESRDIGPPRDLVSNALAGTPIVVFNLLTAVTLSANLLFLQGRVPAAQLGAFAAASAISVTVLSVSGAFRTRVQTVLVASPKLGLHVMREVAIAGAFGLAVAVGGWLLAPQIIGVLLGTGYESAVGPMRILSIAAGVLVLVDMVHGAGVVVLARSALIVVALAGAVTLTVASTVLIPIFGIDGAAIATLCAYLSVVLAGAIAIGVRLTWREAR